MAGAGEEEGYLASEAVDILSISPPVTTIPTTASQSRKILRRMHSTLTFKFLYLNVMDRGYGGYCSYLFIILNQNKSN